MLIPERVFLQQTLVRRVISSTLLLSFELAVEVISKNDLTRYSFNFDTVVILSHETISCGHFGPPTLRTRNMICRSSLQFMLKSVDSQCSISGLGMSKWSLYQRDTTKNSSHNPVSHWIKFHQAMVSAALVQCKNASAGETVCSTNVLYKV
jgi:hypothetical protein